VPQNRLSMCEIQELLRVKYEPGRSHRETAASRQQHREGYAARVRGAGARGRRRLRESPQASSGSGFGVAELPSTSMFTE
jgi:hypothetical protein